MKVLIVGVRTVNYTSKKTGKEVHGFELHYVKEAQPDDEEMNGKYAVSSFTRLDCSKLEPGKNYNLELDVTGSGLAVITGVNPV